MDKNELEKAFIEVRRAYRLIYLYQRRVLDLIEFIANRLNLTLQGGWSKFSEPAPVKTRVKLNRWSWDWITLYLYDFHFGKIKDNIYFSIILQSDSGYFESDTKDKLAISSFLSADKSSTRLFFVLAKGVWGCPIKNFLEDYLGKSDSCFEKKLETDKFWIGKSYDLTEFIEEDSTVLKLKDFTDYAKTKNIDLNFI